MDRWAVVAVLGIVLAAPGGATVRTARADALGKGADASAASFEVGEPPGAQDTTGPAAHTKIEVARKIVTVVAVHRVVLDDVVRVVVDLDGEAPFHDERIPGPPRIFVDFTDTRAAHGLGDRTLRFDDDGDIVRQVRIGRHPNAMTRVVLDATSVSSYSVYPLYNPYRLVIDCVRDTAPPVPLTEIVQESGAVPLTSRSVGGPWGRLPSVRSPAVTRLADLSAPQMTGASPPIRTHVPLLVAHKAPFDWNGALPSAAPRVKASVFDTLSTIHGPEHPHATLSATAAGPSSPPATRSSASNSLSMARQLGLGVSRVVIDPGHGGHDPGAQSMGVTEAEVVLDVALRLEKLLEDTHRFDVILTRRADEFVPLPERTAIANRESADLFVSIHVNASASAQARGIETYYLNFATNESAAAVAARENTGSGQAMGALTDFVRAIALNNKLDESRDLATLVQHVMIEQLRGANKTVRSLGVKQAPFVVLIGATMPSVLTEISFLTNPREAKLLKSLAYRQQIASALFGAIVKYQSSLAGPAAVASHQ